MTRQELMNRYERRIETLRQELWLDPDGCDFGVTSALDKIIRERNEMLKAYGFKLSKSDRCIGFDVAAV